MAYNNYVGGGAQPTSVTYNYGGAPATDSSGGLGSMLGGLIGAGASIYGSQNAAEAATKGNIAGIGTMSPYTSLGAGATGNLGAALGIPGYGSMPSLSEIPGFDQSLALAQQAQQRSFAAQGSAYTPNEAIAVGNATMATAMPAYQNYVANLQSAAGLGYQGAGTTAQLQSNAGMNQASGYASTGGAIGNFLGGPGGSSLIGNLASGVGNLFGGSGGANSSGAYTGAPGQTGFNSYGAPVNYIGGSSSSPGDWSDVGAGSVTDTYGNNPDVYQSLDSYSGP